MTPTVPEAARRTGRSPETIRRWIREGKLASRKVGRQHMIDEGDLDAAVAPKVAAMPLPASWQRTLTGEPVPDWVALLRHSRSHR